jgi:Ca2+-binding RTX toxin-like protein
VLLEGTYQDDILTASWEADTLDAVDGHSLAVEIRGYAGDDILLGSTSMDPSYTEQLRGFKGNDRLKGFAGDDELRGGHHDDQLSGGSGDDVLVAGRHGQNKLYGGGGSDTLCSERPGDLLVAAFAPESSVVNFLYLSSIGVGGVNPDTTAGGTPSLCGHPVYGSLWGGCTFHNQTTAPARCADFGVQD